MEDSLKPLFIYDGECLFCCRWVNRWRLQAGDKVDFLKSAEASGLHPEIAPCSFDVSVQFLENEKVYSGAEAVFRMLAYAPQKKWLRFFYRYLPGFRGCSEWFYRTVARRRGFFSRLTRVLWGNNLEPSTYRMTRSVFTRGLALVYIAAFLSLWTQIHGLIGVNGLIPFQESLQQVFMRYGQESYRIFPTLAWLYSDEVVLDIFCGGGIILSLLLLAGFLPAFSLFALWALYLSLVTIGRDFLGFQWDILLLETGFLAVFFAPLVAGQNSGKGRGPSGGMRFLLWLLLFKLMYSSGLVKLASGDETWKSLTALDYHYFTQPIPNPVSWYAHQLPSWFQRACVSVMFVIELFLPFLIWFPRRLRNIACAGFIFLQALILLTGNYAFFNWLTIFLSLMLLDDQSWPRFFRKKAESPGTVKRIFSLKGQDVEWPRAVVVCVMILILFLYTAYQWTTPQLRRHWPSLLQKAADMFRPFALVNGYGLFAVMTTSRPEIIMEGSEDGSDWKEYEFRFKPGRVDRMPPWVAPHQPRLDWQMWFAALSGYQRNPWFLNLAGALLQGRPQVLHLLEKNPFPDSPPRYVRAIAYDYRFAAPAERKQTGAWWVRSNERIFLPQVSLKAS